MPGHTDLVNAIKFFRNSSRYPQIVLSGSVDKTVRIWRLCKPDPEIAAVLEGHTSSINCLAVLPRSNIVASGSADATIKIWRLDVESSNLETELLQTIQISPKFIPLTLALHGVGNNGDVLLAVAGTKSTVQVYVCSESRPFEMQATLTGHEGWIRSVSISKETTSLESDLLLASASQDKYIRLWRISGHESRVPSEGNDLIETFEESLSNKRHKLRGSHANYLLTFEALLLGHEDWIYTASWYLDDSKIQLLSTSADNSVAIWEPEVSSGIWLCTTRLGEISAQKGSTTATGSTGGFWMGFWSANGDSIVSLGRTGSWRMWNYDRGLNRWVQGIGISGHTKPVSSISWSGDGTYLLSTGLDQTTRLHAEWRRGTRASWHEMARPQIHGYDLNCIDSISQNQFISGADEKLLRVFDESRNTAELLRDLCKVQITNEQDLPDVAGIPVLGLSNKTIETAEPEASVVGSEVENHPDSTEEPISNGHQSVQNPPLEDQLARHTLWPEREKLYGHGYEISAVAASHDGTIVATGCKASSLDHAVIRLYTTKDWREVRPPLTAHSLTITTLAFSKDDRSLLSAGRDRQWALFERNVSHAESYSLRHSNSKGHSRMILDACWAPPESGRVFATAGRDKTVKLWSINGQGVECKTILTASSSVTAVDIAPRLMEGNVLVASGLESGEVCIYAVDLTTWMTRSISVLRDL